MNPQMNYTPQQVMGHDSYSVPCRVGNWAEDEYMGALLTGDHQARSEKGMLMTQKLESTLGSALAPTGLTVIHPDGNLRFGDEIMLSNAQGGVLATNPQVREKLSQHTFVTSRTMVERPCRRTCFRIVPHSAAAPEDGLLRFGMAFGLMSVGDDGEELHLQSMRYTMANMNFSRSVRGAERKNGVNMAVDVSWQTAWEVVLLAPAPLAQLRSEGMPVPANTYVALRHKSSQANLRTTLDCLLRVTTHDSPLTTHHSPLTSHHSPLTTHHSPLATHHSPLTTHHRLQSHAINGIWGDANVVEQSGVLKVSVNSPALSDESNPLVRGDSIPVLDATFLVAPGAAAGSHAAAVSLTVESMINFMTNMSAA